VIKPTVGRVVWFWEDSAQKQPLASMVCYVHNDTMVNLVVFDVNGNSQSKTSVYLYQGDTDRPSRYFAEWMPYQQGQAAKTEALEKQMQMMQTQS
jgi:hypothetical protein